MPSDNPKQPLTCKLSAEAHQVFRAAQEQAGLPHLSDIPKTLLTLAAGILQAGKNPIEILQRSIESPVTEPNSPAPVETPDTEIRQDEQGAQQHSNTHEQTLNLALAKMEQMIDDFTLACEEAEQERLVASKDQTDRFTTELFARLDQVIEPYLKPQSQEVLSKATLDEQSEELIKVAFEQTQVQLARFTAVSFELLRHAAPHLTDLQLQTWKKELGETPIEPRLRKVRSRYETELEPCGTKPRHTKRL